MTIQNYYQKLVDTGLPVTSASDGGDATFSRSLTDLEEELLMDIILPFSIPSRERYKAAKTSAVQVADWIKSGDETAAMAYVDAHTGNVNEMRKVVREMAGMLIAVYNLTMSDVPDIVQGLKPTK